MPHARRRSKHMYTMHRKTSARGFTLIEVIVGLTIGVVIATVLTLTVSTGLRSMRGAKHRERLHANAVFLTNALDHWVKQGVLLQTPTPSTLAILLPDSSTKTIAKTGNRVTLDGNALTSDDVVVSGLVFSRMTRSVRIAFSMQKAGSSEIFSVTTTVAQRNAF